MISWSLGGSPFRKPITPKPPIHPSPISDYWNLECKEIPDISSELLGGVLRNKKYRKFPANYLACFFGGLGSTPKSPSIRSPTTKSVWSPSLILLAVTWCHLILFIPPSALQITSKHTCRSIPFSKYLVPRICEPFRPFGRNKPSNRGLTITIFINHVSKSWDDPPSSPPYKL